MNYLTSLRGIAAVIVILYHIKSSLLAHQFTSYFSFFYAKGYLGVDFFLILSGFIICLKYNSTFGQKLSTKDLYNFIIKRLARILPLHAFVMIGFCIIPLILVISGRPLPSDNYSLLQFLVKLLMIDLWTTQEYFWNSWNIPSWTISGEFFAYLMFPFIAYLIHNLDIRIKIVWYLFLLVLIASAYEFNGSRSLGDNISNLGLLRCMVGFSLGMCVYYFYNEVCHAKKNYASLAKNAFFILIGIFGLLAYNFIGNHFFVPVCFSLLLFLILLFKSSMHQLLESRILVYIGDISYSIYLNHTFVLYVLTMALLDNDEIAGYGFILSYLFITFLVSSFTYKMVELPARNWLGKKLVRLPTIEIRAKDA